MLYGIDISHFQVDGVVPWAQVAQKCQFVICRATYGTKRDRLVVEHVQRVRDLGLAVGLYHFFRAGQAVNAQLDAFVAVADAVRYGPLDIIPALDLEDDTAARPLDKSWSEPAEELASLLAVTCGDCLIYTTQRDWHRLGKPTWILRRPMWVAHWTSAPQPATPGDLPWRLWQYSVGPFNPDVRQRDTTNSRALDHNYAMEPLPLIPRADERVASIDPDTIPWVTGRTDDWMVDYRRSRDELLKDRDAG